MMCVAKHEQRFTLRAYGSARNLGPDAHLIA